MDYIYIYYYDKDDEPHRVQCLQVDFEGDKASFRNANGDIIEINTDQIEKIRAY